MLRTVTYVRKSTDDPKRQLLSLRAQRRVNEETAKRAAVRIIHRWQESMSAKKPGRPVFNRMLDDIEAGRADAIICWSINRLFRNPVDEGRVRWMLQQGIIKSIRTAQREYLPGDAGLLLAIEGGQASDEISKLRANVNRGIEETLLSGAWPGRRPPGYAYDYEKKNIFPHPKHGKFVPLIFSEVSEGNLSLDRVAQRLAELGYKSRTGKPWSKFKIQWFLTNPLYIGIMRWNGKIYEGKYKPLVSVELFKKVAAVLKVRSKPRLKRKSQEFPLRGLFRCSCSSMLTAQVAHGNGGTYRYYRCSRSHGICSEAYICEIEITKQCIELLSPLLHPARLDLGYRILDEMASKQDASSEAHLTGLEKALASVQNELNVLTRAYSKVQVDDESYTAIATTLLVQKAELKRQIRSFDRDTSLYWIEPIKEVLNTLELAAKQPTAHDLKEMSRLIRKIGTNHVYTSKRVSFSLGEPYRYLAQQLGKMPRVAADNEYTQDNELNSRSIWLSILSYLRTHFSAD